MDPIIGGALISGGASVLGSALGFGTQAKNFKNQKKLMRIQQEYARENATTQYNRQRDLTRDSWALNVAGQRAAGINPSFVDGSVSGNTPSVGAADAPPIPSADMDAVGVGNMFTNVGNNAAHILTAISDSKLKEQQAKSQSIDNITRLSENLARLAKMKGEAKTAEARGDIDEQLKEQTKLFESMSMRDKLAMLQNDRSVSDIYANLYGDMAQNKLALLRNQVREAYYNGEIKKKDFEAYDKRLQNELLQGSARAALDYANASVAPTQAALNNSLAELNRSKTVGQNLENHIKSATKDDVVAIMHSNRVKAWYDAQPKDVQQIIMSSQAVRDAVTTLQNGRELSWSEYKALGAAMGYENAGKLVGTLIDALNLKAKGNTKVSVVKHVSSKK